MKKSDIEYHGPGYGWKDHPAVNVKVDAFDALSRSGLERLNDGEFTDPAFPAWLEEHGEECQLQETVWEMALRSGWDLLQSDAEEIFGSNVKVYSAGRSGGWAYIGQFTREDVETWDAIALGRWAKWCRWARGTADGIPYDMLWHAYHNVFLPEVEPQRLYAFGCDA